MLNNANIQANASMTKSQNNGFLVNKQLKWRKVSTVLQLRTCS